MQGFKEDDQKLFYQFSLVSRIPEDNFYRRLKAALDLSFLKKKAASLYGSCGQQSIDTAVFFKMVLVGYLENIPSDRRLIDFCNMRMDILYFLNYDIDESLPWHSTISRTRQLFGKDLFEELFNKVLEMCIDKGMVAGHTQAIDAAFVKANASLDSLEIKKAPCDPDEYINQSFSLNEEPIRKASNDRSNSDQNTMKAQKRELDEINRRQKNWQENPDANHRLRSDDTRARYPGCQANTHQQPQNPA